MYKKIIGVLLMVLGFSGVGFVAYKEASRYTYLQNQLNKYLDRDAQLDDMKRTLQICYNLSEYEARYYSFIFYDFSQKYQLPWEAYPALIRIESNFNSGVMSKKKAKGMTQVLEATGRGQAKKLGISFNEGTLWNCVLNMVIGLDYFSEGYAEKAGGTSQDSALKIAMHRYCGGPGYATVNPDAKLYLKDYKNTVWDEYQRVKYIYQGVFYDRKNHKN